MFIDADTIVTEEAFTWVRRNLKPNQFLIAQTLREKKDLVGFLVVPVSHYLVVGGFDESIMDWGAEDLDLRVRLFLQAKIGFAEMPTPYLGSIPHPDSDRTARYEVKDTQESNNRNFDRLVRNALLSAPGLSAEQIFRHQPICRLLGGCIVGSPALGGKRR
jgi:hypothetical protein